MLASFTDRIVSQAESSSSYVGIEDVITSTVVFRSEIREAALQFNNNQLKVYIIHIHFQFFFLCLTLIYLGYMH